MVFSSVTFVYLFLPVVLALYFAIPNLKVKNYILLLASLFFYGWGEPKWIITMVLNTVIAYVAAFFIAGNKGKNDKKAKLALAICCAFSLGDLFVFKYLDFTIFNLNSLFGSSLPLTNLALPIGISFYTFQTLTYVIDVYRGKAEVQQNFAWLLLYVSMFPQLIAGPIVKYTDVMEQIGNRQFDWLEAGKGVLRFLVGLTKKIVFANIAGELASHYLDGDLLKLSTLGAWVGLLAYSFQIYFDFSAYSDMAIGLGHMFGFQYKENFNYPYIAASINDFWKRWHISLTTFFREYLYFPLGGNQRHHVLNLLIVWALTGLWHGASWNFIMWGLYYFIFIVLEKLVLRYPLEHLPKIFGHIYTLFVVMIGWALFYFDDMDRLRTFLKTLFGIGKQVVSVAPTDKSILLNYMWFLIIAVIGCTPVIKIIKNLFASIKEKGRVQMIACNTSLVIGSVALLLLDTAFMVGSTYNPFLYFRF